MKRLLKILLFSFLIICIFVQYKIFDREDLNPSNNQQLSNSEERETELVIKENVQLEDYFTGDTIYRWDEQELGWVATNETQEIYPSSTVINSDETVLKAPIELEWEILMDIQYKLRYFKELEMEVYAPVFSKAAKAFHGKEVIIEGFVIPYDESGEVLSLSYNPFASCFFCGKASPASIISMYLKDKGKRYKLDDFKKFRGKLFLNYDDPDEFYYILKDAREVK